MNHSGRHPEAHRRRGARRLVDEGYETAKRILTEKREDLERLAKGLLEYETLTGSEITRVIAGEPLKRGERRRRRRPRPRRRLAGRDPQDAAPPPAAGGARARDVTRRARRATTGTPEATPASGVFVCAPRSTSSRRCPRPARGRRGGPRLRRRGGGRGAARRGSPGGASSASTPRAAMIEAARGYDATHLADIAHWAPEAPPGA